MNNKEIADMTMNFVSIGLALGLSVLILVVITWVICGLAGIVFSLSVSVLTAFIASFLQLWLNLGAQDKQLESIKKETADLPPDDEEPPEE